MIDKILEIIENYMLQSDIKSTTYVTLQSLYNDVEKLTGKKKIITRDKCSICKKLSSKLWHDRYCMDCYDKFID